MFPIGGCPSSTSEVREAKSTVTDPSSSTMTSTKGSIGASLTGSIVIYIV